MKILIRVTTGLVLSAALTACSGGSGGSIAPPLITPPATTPTLDLAGFAPASGFVRVSGAASTGRFGVPVAAGLDCDGDSVPDFAMSGMLASPLGRNQAGQVVLIFGDGRLDASLDSAMTDSRMLIIAGTAPNEATGSEIWMDDVTGDGVGDLLVGRQNYREPLTGRIGAGALTVVVGGPGLKDLAAAAMVLDLAAPPASVTVLTLVGAAELDRFGFWMRTGDVTGDGVADLLIGADQQDGGGESNRGAAYLVRGGAHLNRSGNVDLAGFGSTVLAGHILRIDPGPGSVDYHFGGTVALADLDGNGRHDALVAASLSRAGGQLLAEGAPAGSATRHGGNLGGSLFILWDDNFGTGAQWPAGQVISTDNAPGATSRIDGGLVAGMFSNQRFGEDVLGGEDYNGDGVPDLFVGDIRGLAGDGRTEAGVGHILFSSPLLVNRNFSMSAVPADIAVTTVLGASAFDISSDTALHGDFDGDGRTDLGLAAPLADPLGREDAGSIHVLWGQPDPWPEFIELGSAGRPDPASFVISDILGARGGNASSDAGDTLMYSAVAADLDSDGRDDLVINEMRGNGVAASAIDVGNLLIISGALIPR